MSGGEDQLKALMSAFGRLASGPKSEDTTMIQNGGHRYAGEEGQVAQTVYRWGRYGTAVEG